MNKAVPSCYVCETSGKPRKAAVYVAYIIEQIGPVYGRSWQLVCVAHRHDFPAYKLVEAL